MKRDAILLMVWAGFVCFARFLKIGEFSCLAVTLPVIAYFFRTKTALPAVGGAWALTHLGGMPLTLGVPTYLATLSWRAQSKTADRTLHIAFPLLCMLLFRLSPVGAKAWPYSLYWLAPMALCLFNLGIFGRALKSTFVAHAAGSVIWAYAVPMPPETWLGLIPTVAVERLLCVGLSLGLIGVLELVRRKTPSQERAAFASL